MSIASENSSPAKRHFIRFLYTFPYLLILYVLSTGPLYWQIYDAYQPDGSVFLRGLYYPVILACESSDYVSNFFHWYAMLWAFPD